MRGLVRWCAAATGTEAASCASGGGRSISSTVVHRACAVLCAGAVPVAVPTDAWWTHTFPRTYLAIFFFTNLLLGYVFATFWKNKNTYFSATLNLL